MNRSDAMSLLIELNAPPRLIKHSELVAEAAALLVTRLESMKFPFDPDFVLAGAVLHDVGKILHPTELNAKGSCHEPDGERLLLQHDVSPALARVCKTHAAWDGPDVSDEELTIALADKLWKGVRKSELEKRLIDRVALRLNLDYWTVFLELDNCFEQIAAGGARRLESSNPG